MDGYCYVNNYVCLSVCSSVTLVSCVNGYRSQFGAGKNKIRPILIIRTTPLFLLISIIGSFDPSIGNLRMNGERYRHDSNRKLGVIKWLIGAVVNFQPSFAHRLLCMPVACGLGECEIVNTVFHNLPAKLSVCFSDDDVSVSVVAIDNGHRLCHVIIQ